MGLFGLDPESIATRALASGRPIRLPTLAESLLRGTVGFMLVSIAGFAPWPIMEHWGRGLSGVHLYLACAAAFLGMSGVCLHRLIIGPGSLSGFYKLFALAFGAYSVAWVSLWMILRGDMGSFGGLLGGAVAMGAILALAFDAYRTLPHVIATIFTLNTIGYYLGGRLAGKLAIAHRPLGMLLWGAAYGIGLGAALGVAFYLCQTEARALISARIACPNTPAGRVNEC